MPTIRMIAPNDRAVPRGLSIGVREQVIRHAGANLDERRNAWLDATDVVHVLEAHGKCRIVDLQRYPVLIEQAFDHLCIAEVIGKFFVLAADVEFPGKLMSLEIDVAATESLGNSLEQPAALR